MKNIIDFIKKIFVAQEFIPLHEPRFVDNCQTNSKNAQSIIIVYDGFSL